MYSFKDHLKESCDCWKGHKRVPGTKPCAPGSCVKESLELDESLDPSEIASNPKMYDASIAKKAYYHKSATASDKESLARHLDRHHGNKEWRKAVKEDTVSEGAPIVVMPRADRLKKAEPTTVRNQGDIVPPTKPPSTEKRGVKGRPGQRPMPTYEELSADDMFDIIEELVIDLAEEHSIDPEVVWEKLESIDDDTLFEAAIDAKGHKSSTGGLTQKGVDAYNRKTGGNLKMAVTTPPSKLKPGSKAANRRKSFCARMSGVDGPMKKPNGEPTRKALALRKWNC